VGKPQLSHERLPDCDPFTKYAAAFVKKSRSILIPPPHA
jgi:hypothetical protein